METDTLTPPPAARTVDLSGLPDAVARDVALLVQSIREAHAPVAGRKPLFGRLAHLAHLIPPPEELDAVRREAWTSSSALREHGGGAYNE